MSYYEDDEDDGDVVVATKPLFQLPEGTDWREVKFHFGKKSGTKLGDLTPRDLRWWYDNWFPNDRFCKHTANCPDCILRAAIRAGASAQTETPAAQAPTPQGDLKGQHVGTVGEKLTVEVTVESKREFTTEFNRKKIVQEVAILRDAEGNCLKWVTQNLPVEVVEGATITITGTVKDQKEYKGERVTAIKLVKVAGAVKLKPAHQIILFCDAKAAANQFAYCAADGSVLEYGALPYPAGTPEFYPGYHEEQSNGEVCAGILAFNFARRVKEAAGLECLALTFNFDAQWMQGMVGKAKPLRDFAKKHGLVVKMNWVAGATNPADEWTTASGSKSVPDAELAAFALPL